MSPRPDDPDSIGPYRVLSVLGSGGFSRVYRVVREGGGGFRKELALKVLAPDVEPTQDMTMMMADEARIARHLHHRNIVAVHEFGESDGVYWLLMDLVDGVDLRSVLASQRTNRGWLPLPATIEVIYRVLHGLHYAHGRRAEDGKPLGIVHRDLTPGNVLIGRNGQVCITDFGLARIRDKIAMTQAGITRGTAHYMSPEQAQGGALDHRSDQFAVGVLLYLLVSGGLPYPGGRDSSVMRAIVRGPYKPVSASGVPDTVVAVIERLLAPLPADRYPDALCAAEALVAAVPVGWRAEAERVLGRLAVRAMGGPTRGS